MTKSTDPFAMFRHLMDAQKAQLDAGQSFVDAARGMQDWQRQAMEFSQTMMTAQKQWLALWGIKG